MDYNAICNIVLCVFCVVCLSCAIGVGLKAFYKEVKIREREKLLKMREALCHCRDCVRDSCYQCKFLNCSDCPFFHKCKDKKPVEVSEPEEPEAQAAVKTKGGEKVGER